MRIINSGAYIKGARKIIIKKNEISQLIVVLIDNVQVKWNKISIASQELMLTAQGGAVLKTTTMSIVELIA